jgi:hypothetical protein
VGGDGTALTVAVHDNGDLATGEPDRPFVLPGVGARQSDRWETVGAGGEHVRLAFDQHDARGLLSGGVGQQLPAGSCARLHLDLAATRRGSIAQQSEKVSAMVPHRDGDPAAVGAELEQVHRLRTPGSFVHESLGHCNVSVERLLPAAHVGFVDLERGDWRWFWSSADVGAAEDALCRLGPQRVARTCGHGHHGIEALVNNRVELLAPAGVRNEDGRLPTAPTQSSDPGRRLVRPAYGDLRDSGGSK